MKRTFVGILITALLLSTFPAALAEPLCKASEVDLSDVQEVNGRLIGEIHVPDGMMDAQLRIDCPLPEGFTQEQSQKLTVQYKRISEREMIAAMKTIGQKGTPETVSVYNSSEQTLAEFSLLKHGDPRGYFWGDLMAAEASDDPAYEVEYTQAKNLIQALITQLGGTADQNLLHATRLDTEHCYPYSTSISSKGEAYKADSIEYFKTMEAKDGIVPNTLTTVSGPYALYGLPVMRNIRWMEGRDEMGAETAFYAVVHDNGSLQYCGVACLPVVTDTKPVSLPIRSWQELLAGCIANGWCRSIGNSEERTKKDTIYDEMVTYYASYPVITEIHPCWFGNDKHAMVPGYYMSIEERVEKDGSLIYPWSAYGDAETLTSID